MPNRIRVVPARETDLDLVLDILDESAAWLVTKGVSGPWRPGSSSRAAFRDQILRGEAYLAKFEEKTIGTVTLQWNDEVFWPHTPSDAGYIHKLALRPLYFGERPRCPNA